MNNVSNKKKITVISSYYEPDVTACTYLFVDLAKDFHKYGAEISVVCGIPNRLVKPEITKYYSEHQIEKVDEMFTVYRVGPSDSEGKNFIYRVFYHLYRSYAVYKKAKNLDTDIYIICSAPPFMGIAGAFLSRKAPTVYNLQDVFPDSLITAKKLSEDSLIIRLFRKVEKWIYKKNTHIITITKDFNKLLLGRGVPQEKISTIYNWIDENAVVPIERQNNCLINRYNIEKSKFIVTYCGNIGHSQNLEMVVDIAKELGEDVQFVFIGDGGWKNNIEQYIVNKKVINVMMLPFQPYGDIAHVMSLGDVSLVCSKANVGNSSFPSKTWSIMSAGRAVICSFDKNSELCEIINTAKAGLCSDAGDKKGLKNNILKLYADRKLTKELGENGRKYIEKNLTRKQATRKYFDILCSVVNKPKGASNDCK